MSLTEAQSTKHKAPFLKMNGAGNDFIVFDARKAPLSLTPAQCRALADRANPITKGCDQIVLLALPPATATHHQHAFMRIYNADGSESSACGNASRCVAWLLMKETGSSAATIETKAGTLQCERDAQGNITVNMGPPRFNAAEIPANATLDLNNITCEGLTGGIAVGMGNPHIVFFGPDAEAVDLKTLGPKIEHRTDLFPQRVNVSIASTKHKAQSTKHELTLRVWERGAGLTQACGTAACATLTAAVKRGLIEGHKADMHLPGGILPVEWRDDGNIWLGGPVELEFEGEVSL